MEDGKFDALSRRLGRIVTRRQGLAAAMAALFGGAGQAVEDAAAGSKGGKGSRGGGPVSTQNGKNRGKRKRQQCSAMCGGCCAGGSCKQGTTDKFCGKNGKTCKTCGDGETCDKGKCVDVCSAENCDGCCAKKICQPGNSVQACGTGGGRCKECTEPGTVCRGGVCGPPCTVCQSGCSSRTIAAAIADAYPGSTITVDGGTYYESDLTINKNLTIQACDPAAPVIIDSDSYAIKIASANPTLVNVTLRNMTVKAVYTGVTIEKGSVVKLEGMTITNCGYRGAIDNRGSATVTDCIIQGNQGSRSGAIQNGDSYTTTTGVVMVIEGNTVIRDNQQTKVPFPSSDSSGGGGIRSYNSSLTVRGNTLITANSAATKGGGIYAAGGSLTVSGNAKITGNSADCYGGVYLTSDGSNTVLPVVTGVTPTSCTGNSEWGVACSCKNYSLNEGSTCPNS